MAGQYQWQCGYRKSNRAIWKVFSLSSILPKITKTTEGDSQKWATIVLAKLLVHT